MRPWIRIVLIWALSLAVAVGVFWGLREMGAGLTGPYPPPERYADPDHTSDLARVLLALGLITVASRSLGWVVGRWLKQPPVVGEVMAGLALGPSLLGGLAPGLLGALLPTEVATQLGMLAKVGVVLFMFVVGLELDGDLFRKHSRGALNVATLSIALPFLLGVGIALPLLPLYGVQGVSFTPFALFVGACMSVTAFPVLARILKDIGVQRTPLGTTALACAAINDVVAWTLLALVVGVARSDVVGAARTLPWIALYLVLMFGVVRPLFRVLSIRERRRREPLSQGFLAAVVVGLMLSAAATEWIGIHALFGAFLFGATLPHRGELADALRHRVEDLVVVLFLPAFFAFTGLRTQIGLVETGQDWLFCGIIVLLASVGKMGGGAIAARFSGMPWRRSLALGALMNTRGLIELIALNMGLDLGIISPPLFAMMVLMALVTTLMTSPLLHLLAGNDLEGLWEGPRERSSA